jgi:hypothetical protein
MTKKYEVRLLMEVEADNPYSAVDGFIGALVQDGFKIFMYRVQDLDGDPLGLDPVFIQNGELMSLNQAADRYGISLGEEDDEDDDEDQYGDQFGPYEVDTDADDSVVSNVTE